MADVIFNVEKGQYGDVGIIILDRVRSLNALTFDMVKELHRQLIDWQNDLTIKAVLVKSNSPKAFCAGGDVVSLYDMGLNSPSAPLAFFNLEYTLNCLIASYSKPYICLLDGITMGGGVGISLHGKYPLATGKFSFAMPETGIGFFPDVGGGYLLTRCNQSFGRYLALTGKRINTADALLAGVIKYTISHEKQSDFIRALKATDLSHNSHQAMTLLIQEYKDDKNLESKLALEQDYINDVFKADSIEDIFSKLQGSDNDWSIKTLKILNSKSPTALKVTLEQLKQVKGLSMPETMKIEYRIVNRFMQNKDFFEGVRSLLIDKDGKPNWHPSSLSDVDEQEVNEYFEPLETEFEFKKNLQEVTDVK